MIITGILTNFRKRTLKKKISEDFIAFKSKVTHFYNGVCNQAGIILETWLSISDKNVQICNLNAMNV